MMPDRKGAMIIGISLIVLVLIAAVGILRLAQENL